MKSCLLLISTILTFISCSSQQVVPQIERAIASDNVPYKVLYFGDSQSAGPLGAILSKKLEDVDFKEQTPPLKNLVYHFSKPGSSPRHWGDALNRPGRGKWLCEKPTWRTYQTDSSVFKYSEVRGERFINQHSCTQARAQKISAAELLVAQTNPDLVIFQFLGNSAFFYDQAQKIKSLEKREKYLASTIGTYFSELLDTVGNRDCLFVTSNPAYKSAAAKMRSRLGLQAWIKTFLITRYPNCKMVEGITDETIQSIASSTANYFGDKMHMNKAGAEIFSDYVIKNLNMQLEK